MPIRSLQTLDAFSSDAVGSVTVAAVASAAAAGADDDDGAAGGGCCVIIANAESWGMLCLDTVPCQSM